MDIQKQMLSIREDENFLCGLFTEHMPPVVVYLLYAGDATTYYLWADKQLLSTGRYKPSPLHDWDTIENLVDLLNYLLLQPGAADQEYFKDHSKEYLSWLDSTQADELRMYVDDFLNGESEYREVAKEYFKKYWTE